MTFQQRVIEITQQIPYGKVTTYGTVAALAGSPRAAIIVGQVLRYQSQLHQLPWQRVINKDGYITINNPHFPAEMQVALLEAEGITVEKKQLFKVDLKKFGWFPSSG